MINFRLTEEEYTTLMGCCSAQGSRCLSDFARSAVLTQSKGENNGLEYIETRLTTLDERLLELRRQVCRVLDLLESPTKQEDR